MTFRKLVLTLWFLIGTSIVSAQIGEHPRIYISNSDKSDFLQTLEEISWKKELVARKKERLHKFLEYWQNDPEWLVSRLQMNWKTKHDEVYLQGGDFSHSKGSAPVPTVRYSGTRDWASDYKRPKLEEVQPYLDDPKGLYLEHKKTGVKEWVHPSKAGFAIEKINEEIMGLVADAAFLYWLTDDEEYAKFAAPVFLTYMDGMHYRHAPVDLKKSSQQNISGLATFEVIHEGIVVDLVTAYDFLHHYFKAQNISLDTTIAVLQKWGDQIIEKGIPDNNWNLFQARFLTYIALVLEGNSNYVNGKGREYFLDHTFNISTDRQLAIKESLLVYDQDNGIWPESASYSVHVITTLLRIFTLLDHATNNNEFLNFPIIEKAALASFQYLFPTGYMVGFGDSGHKILPPENFELLIANYKKYDLQEKEAMISGLLNQMISKGLYKREAKDYFELFFYVDALEQGNADAANIKKLTSPTFYASNVSMFNQRMGEGDEAVMVSTVGSYGNHAHANGISMELFAHNLVLGPDMGKGPSYWHPAHREFYSRFPAHNTVVVDGRSDYSAMRSFNPYQLENAYPKSGKRPNFEKLTYSLVSFVELESNADQQRFTAIIGANTSKKYIMDVFRSKKQDDGPQKHEYIYHNIGQSLQIFENNSLLKLEPTNDLSTKEGDLKGYDYFTDKYKTQTTEDITALFTLKSEHQSDVFMKLWVKGSKDQTIYRVHSPKSNALTKGTAPIDILEEPLPTLILKREEEAWENPFAVVYNPYTGETDKVIENVSYSSLPKYPNTQIVKVLLSDKSTTDRLVLNASENDVVKDGAFYQKGLLSVSRTLDGHQLDYIFLSGMYKFENEGWDIAAYGEPCTLAIERMPDGYSLQNDRPITINIPFDKGKIPAELHVFENGKLVAKRKGTTNRNNDNQLVFKLEKAYQKALIVFQD